MELRMNDILQYIHLRHPSLSGERRGGEMRTASASGREPGTRPIRPFVHSVSYLMM
jgi:hypothetical protein